MTKPKTLLIVDDDPDLREVLAEQLQLQQEFEVIQAKSGAEGLEAVKRDHVDLVLLDVGLPDGSGFDLAEEIGSCMRPMIDLMPGFADAVYHRPTEGLAILMSAFGIGAMIAEAMQSYPVPPKP